MNIPPKTGLYAGIALADYLADPCEGPSVSSSILHLICSRSPRHAWTAHPKLNPEYQRDEDTKFDLGTAAHHVLLEGGRDLVVVAAPDWRTKEAQTRRDAARLAGKMPLLREQWDRVVELSAAIGPQLSQLEPPRPFSTPTGKPEQTLIWQEHGLWCRARPDWLHDDHRTVDDLKTTTVANPIVFSRVLFGLGYDIKAAWYQRGMKAVLGVETNVRFIVVETEPPYAVSCVALGPEALALAHKKIDYALGVWRTCLETNVWPGYPTATCYSDVPPWVASEWGERLYSGIYQSIADPNSIRGIMDDGRSIGDLLP